MDQEALDDAFIDGFFHHLTPGKMRREYRGVNKYSSSKSPYFLIGEMRQEQLNPLLDWYFSQTHGKLSDRVADAFEITAHEYADLGVDRFAIENDAEGSLKLGQLSSLVRRAEFLSLDVAHPIIFALKDIEDCEPWGFNMYEYYGLEGQPGAPYDIDNDNHYFLRPGFGKEHILGAEKIIDDDALWSGKSSELRRIFMSQCATVCRHLFEQYPLDAFLPRIKVMDKNFSYTIPEEHIAVRYNPPWKQWLLGKDEWEDALSGRKPFFFPKHEPWCNASFTEKEIRFLEEEIEATRDPEIALQYEDMLYVIEHGVVAKDFQDQTDMSQFDWDDHTISYKHFDHAC